MLKIFTLGFFQLILAWYDIWIGAYYDQGHKTLYICPLPFVVLRFQFKGVGKEELHRKDRNQDPRDARIAALEKELGRFKRLDEPSP